MRYFESALEIKSLSDSGEFEGYGSVFGNIDHGGDAVLPGAFAKSLSAHKDAGTLPAMLWQHNHHNPIGVYEEMYEDEKGLYVKGRLITDVQQAREAHALMKAKALRGLSIGYSIKDGGVNKETGAYELKEVDLWEVSPVTFPMNELAQINAVKSRISQGETVSKRDLELILRDAGLSRSTAKAIIADGYTPNQRDADEDAAELLKTAIFGRTK